MVHLLALYSREAFVESGKLLWGNTLTGPELFVTARVPSRLMR